MKIEKIFNLDHNFLGKDQNESSHIIKNCFFIKATSFHEMKGQGLAFLDRIG